MTTPSNEWRVPTLVTASDWLAGDPAALDRAQQLAEHAVDAGEVAELVGALLDAVGVAVGGRAPSLERARRRLDDRAVAAAEASLEAAVDAGRYPSREGQR